MTTEPKENVTQDLVVVLPGIMGSTLYKGDRLVWGTTPGTALAALVTRLSGITPRDRPSPDYCGDGVWAGELITGIQLIPGLWTIQYSYGALLARLESVLGRRTAVYRTPAPPAHRPDPPVTGLIAFPYDWRLSNRINGQRLAAALKDALPRWREEHSRPDARVTFICHSMGGLVARWFAQREGGAEMTSRIVTIGTPHRGAMKALDQLVNGARIGKGPLRPAFTTFARSLPSSYELLPEYACIEVKGTGPPGAPALQTIAEYLGGNGLPGIDTEAVRGGLDFLTTLKQGSAGAPPVLPLVGTRQPTLTTAQVSADFSVIADEEIGGTDEAGDGTVPRLAATPHLMDTSSPTIHWAADKHSALPHNGSVLDQLEGILAAYPAHRGPGLAEVSVRVEEFADAGAPVPVQAEVLSEPTLSLEARVLDEQGRFVLAVPLQAAGGGQHGEIPALRPGAYQVIVQGRRAAAGRVAPVTSLVAVLDPAVT
jgi:pimeloyl-ACP methyl ester carboxylesterase